MKALFIGLGSIGQRHLRNLRSIVPDVDVLALRKTRNVPLLTATNQVVPDQDVNETYNVTEVETLAAALSEGIDLAFVTNPTSLHYEFTQALLNSDMPIFVEKPVCASLDEGRTLLDREAAKGRQQIAVGFQFRHHPALIWIRKAVENGVLGRIVNVQLVNGEYMPGWHPYEDYRKSYAAMKSLGGGAILSQIHDIDNVLWILGGVKSVFAVGGQLSDLEIDVEDSVQVQLSIHNGGNVFPANITLDYLQWPAKRHISIVGDKARLECDLLRNEITLWDRPSKEESVVSFSDFERNDMFLQLMRNFVEFSKGNEAPSVGIEEAVRGLEVAEAAHKSLVTNSVVNLDV